MENKMKKYFIIGIVFLCQFNSINFAQSNCYAPPNIWYRVINQPIYRWYWDGQLNGASFDGYDHILSTAEKQNIVRNAIVSAVNQWVIAVNTNGTVIEDMSESTNSSDASFSFSFNYLYDQAGFTPNATQIQLANNNTVKWTDNYSYAAAGNAIDIITIILHELGHIFLGGGHSVDDGTSLMWNSYPGRPFRSITHVIDKHY